MDVEPMQIGLVFWAEKDARTTLEDLLSFGLTAGQLGIPPSMNCGLSAVAEWQQALQEHPIHLSGAVCAYAGEDYTTLDRVHQTVGFTAPGYAEERIARTKEVAVFAEQLGIKAISCHIGFIPSDTFKPTYTALLEIAREVCDACATHNQDFVLETGQENATTLLTFLRDSACSNLRVNFDPANMILYGSGDPIQALDLLRDDVLSVHCKDGRSPTAPGMLGDECALGEGEVDFTAFLQLLHKMNYRGLLAIEREEPDTNQRAADIHLGVSRLRTWIKSLARIEETS